MSMPRREPPADGLGWRTQAFVVGGVLGAIVGLAAAYLYVQGAEQSDEPPKIGSGEALRLGLLLLGTVRQIAQIGQPDES